MIKGPTGSGKSTLLLNAYTHMVDKLYISSDKILILLMNRVQSLEWRTKTSLPASGNIWRTSYYGFIQSELSRCYPLIIKNCKDIINKDIRPVFLNFESAQFLISKVIDYRRNKNKMFSQITSDTDRISIELTSNLVKAAISEIPYDNVGTRLYNSLNIKEEGKRQTFEEIDCILRDYRKKCIELGVFDFGIAVEIYNEYLLKDPLYRKDLFSRVKFLIVDNIEECVPTQVDLIELLKSNAEIYMCSYNPHGGYGRMFGSNHDYARSKLTENLKIVEVQKPYTCNNHMYEFSEMLFESIAIDSIQRNKPMDDYRNYWNVIIERHPCCELRSEMLREIGERICSLVVDDGYKPSDIVILSTHADPVTEFVIGRIIERRGIPLSNLTRNSRMIDNPFSQALVTLAQLCHPEYTILPNRDDIKCLIRMLLKIDPIRSSILAREICAQRPFARFPDIEFPAIVEKIGYYNIEKYNYVKEWIENYKSQGNSLPIDEFFRKVFLELLVSDQIMQADILQTKKLIDSAQNFVEAVSKFKINASKDFLKMVSKGIKASESIFELEEKLQDKAVIMCTPVNYLANCLKSKVMILTSLSSKNWSPRSAKEITNIHVLTKTWEDGTVYTEKMEEENQKSYLAILMGSIIKRCGDKLITFESNLSGNGYENDGILSTHFDEILNLCKVCEVD